MEIFIFYAVIIERKGNLFFSGRIDYKDLMPGVVACTCNPTTLEAKFRNRVGLIPVGGNSPSIGGWIV